MPTVLVIAASDSSGGAGLSRDVQTLSEFGIFVRCALTAVTAQTDRAVLAVQLLPPEFVVAQIRAALESGAVDAIKIGMLGSAEIVRAVSESLPPRAQIPIVLDPVLASSSGAPLLQSDGIEPLRRMIGRVTLITPNVPEAARLLGVSAATEVSACQTQVQALLALGAHAVLLKGGHSPVGGAQTVTDWLGHSGGQIVPITGPRIPVHRRGTGCSAASAIAAQLAAGVPLEEACKSAQTYLRRALEAARCGSAELP